MVIRNDDYNEDEYNRENEGYVDSSVPSEDDIPDSQDNNSNKEFDDYSNDSGSYDNNFEDSYEESSSSGNGGILDSIINFIKNNKLLVIALVLVIVLLIGLSACSGGKKTSQTTGFTIENPQITLQVGSSQKIVTKTTGGSGNWAFESENISIATVDNQGNVTGKGVGNTTVIVKYLTANQMVYTKPCFVTVSNGDSSVELTDAKFQDGSIEMPLNYEYTLLKEFTPENGYVSSIKFESSDPTVGTVDDNGTVKSLKEGTTDVTMRVNDKFTDTISIKVNKNLSQVVIGRPITALQFAEAEYKVQVGKTIELPLDTNPMQADLSGIEWFTDNSNVATVSGGVVAGISEGEAIITAKYGEISADVKIIVTNETVGGDVTGINVDQESVTMKVSETHDIKVTLVPEGTEAAILFQSSNSAVANVNTEGTVTAYCAGNADITVMLVNNPDIYKTVKITVEGDGTYIDPGDTTEIGGDSGGDVSGGDTSTDTNKTCNGYEISISTNSGGSVSTTKGGNSKTTEVKNLEIDLKDAINNTSCGNFKQAEVKYYVTTEDKLNNFLQSLGSLLTRKTLSSSSSTTKVTIPLGNSSTTEGVEYISIVVTYENGSASKTYWTKFKHGTSAGIPLAATVNDVTASIRKKYNLSGSSLVESTTGNIILKSATLSSTKDFNRIFYCMGTSSNCTINPSVTAAATTYINVNSYKYNYPKAGTYVLDSTSLVKSKVFHLAVAKNSYVCFAAANKDNLPSSSEINSSTYKVCRNVGDYPSSSTTTVSVSSVSIASAASDSTIGVDTITVNATDKINRIYICAGNSCNMNGTATALSNKGTYAGKSAYKLTENKLYSLAISPAVSNPSFMVATDFSRPVTVKVENTSTGAKSDTKVSTAKLSGVQVIANAPKLKSITGAFNSTANDSYAGKHYPIKTENGVNFNKIYWCISSGTSECEPNTSTTNTASTTKLDNTTHHIASSGSYVYNVGNNSSDETINLAFNKTSAVKVCFKVKTSGGTVSSNKVCSDTVAFTPVKLGLISASKVTTDKNSSYGAVKYKITENYGRQFDKLYWCVTTSGSRCDLTKTASAPTAVTVGSLSAYKYELNKVYYQSFTKASSFSVAIASSETTQRSICFAAKNNAGFSDANCSGKTEPKQSTTTNPPTTASNSFSVSRSCVGSDGLGKAYTKVSVSGNNILYIYYVARRSSSEAGPATNTTTSPVSKTVSASEEDPAHKIKSGMSYKASYYDTSYRITSSSTNFITRTEDFSSAIKVRVQYKDGTLSSVKSIVLYSVDNCG